MAEELLLQNGKVLTCEFEKEAGSFKIYKVKLEDGRDGQSFSELHPGDPVSTKEGKEYGGKKPLIFSLIKTQQQGKFPVKDYTFEKRLTAMELSVSMANAKIIELKDLTTYADKIFTWLKQQ